MNDILKEMATMKRTMLKMEKEKAEMAEMFGKKVCRYETQIREKQYTKTMDGGARKKGAVQKEKVIAAVRDGGAFTSVRGYEGDGQRGIRFTTTFVRAYENEFEKLDRLRQLAEEGAITLRVVDSYRPEDAAEAHRRLEAGGTRGRLVIEF